ncbi:hypothetical protein C8R42DRAFT_726802 [Lentinula raphanica]|nr:hypothetical protein C8R42DRAFT_726802 [Lentinula raphanica]
MRGLVESSEDVILLVLDTIRASTSEVHFLKDLQSLSLASRYLRDVCLPVLFRTFRRSWDISSIRSDKIILPSTLCQYVTVFELDVSATGDILLDEPTDISERLVTVFSKMEKLRTFRLINSTERGPWPALLNAIFSTPTLTACEIWDSPWRRPEEKLNQSILDIPRERTQLKRFVYRVPFTECFPRESESYGRRDKVQGPVELSNLLLLTSLVCESVEVLEIPAELALPLVDCVFPNLRELTVQGHEPLQAFDWSAIFRNAPRLGGIHLQTVHTASNRLTTRTPRAASRPSYDDFIVRGMSNLESLTLSEICGKERLLSALPYANLRTLSFKAFPLPGVTGSRWSNIYPRIPTSSEILCILNTVQIVTLSTFELSYSVDSSDISLLSRIHSSFPRLSTLEIHRLRPMAKSNSEDDPLIYMPHTLAKPGSNLRNLKLNLDFPERPRHNDWRQDDSKRDREFHLFLEKEIATRFVHAIHSLQTMQILAHDAFSSYWDTWKITATRELIPQPAVPVCIRL